MIECGQDPQAEFLSRAPKLVKCQLRRALMVESKLLSSGKLLRILIRGQ